MTRPGRIEEDGRTRGPAARQGHHVVVIGRCRSPDVLDGIARGEQPPNVLVWPAEGVGDDGLCAARDPACGEIVGALTGDLGCRIRGPRLTGPAGIAEVAEHDDRVRREVDGLRQERFAEVLVGMVVDACDRIEAEPVLRPRERLRSIGAGKAVAVPEIDDDRGALEGAPDRRPGRIRRGDRDHVGRPSGSLFGSRRADGAVSVGQLADRPDDDDHLGWVRRSRNRRGLSHQARDQQDADHRGK